MAMGNGCDRRYSSFAGEIDAAIERVVSHFEESDVALRLDVLRSLTVQAKLAFETERIKQRLLQHPVTKELIERVTTQSTLFERLHASLSVEDYNCDYDRQRNVEMSALVRWTLPQAEETKKSSKKRRARTSDKPLCTQYSFTRTASDDGETVVTYTVAVGVGVGAPLKQLVRFELASDSPYPRSFYEDDHDMDSDEDEEQKPGDADDEQDKFGESVRAFEFDEHVLDGIFDWVDAEHEDIDPADVVGFFFALPVYEDDWMIDERVCQILFHSGEMEEEEVSNFDEEEENDLD